MIDLEQTYGGQNAAAGELPAAEAAEETEEAEGEEKPEGEGESDDDFDDGAGPTISARALLTSQEKVKETRIDTAMVTDRPGMAPM